MSEGVANFKAKSLPIGKAVPAESSDQFRVADSEFGARRALSDCHDYLITSRYGFFCS
jgi:hypothetical protein